MASRIPVRSEANQRERARNFNASKPATLHPLPGDNSCVEPPDPIPNSEVKRARADGSVHLACESRSSPGSLSKTPQPRLGGFSLRVEILRQIYRPWIRRAGSCLIGNMPLSRRGLFPSGSASCPRRLLIRLPTSLEVLASRWVRSGFRLLRVGTLQELTLRYQSRALVAQATPDSNLRGADSGGAASTRMNPLQQPPHCNDAMTGSGAGLLRTSAVTSWANCETGSEKKPGHAVVG